MHSWVPRGRDLFLFDVAATAAAIVVAFALRFDASDVVSKIRPYMPVALLPMVILPPVYIVFGLYRREWRYASVQEMGLIVFAVLVGMTITFVSFVGLALAHFAGTAGFSRSIFIIEGLVSVALVGGSRFALRAALERRGVSGGTSEEKGIVRTIVYGAGETGATVARVAARDPAARLNIVGFIDDEVAKQGSRLMGKKVFGGYDELGKAARETRARQLLVAMPTASGQAVRRAYQRGRELGLEVRTVPHPRELLSGESQVGQIRRVSVDDLLRREQIEIDVDAVADYINGASVLVTGGGGSIGSELVRQIIAIGPRFLTVMDNHEEALWSIERELSERATGSPGVQFEPVLADIRSADATEGVIRRSNPDVVFHAAALKHVPIVELAPSEGVLTNVFGTRNVLNACERLGVGRFVLISTDKAVEPVSVMGATKRLAELITVAAARRTGRPYVAVRFGNVLGSSGSVIPTFRRQLEQGHPLTITHPEATRYFMTIPEAVSLILEAGATAASGDVYVLDMGEPVKIVDLARDLISLSGLDPESVPIIYTGLRAGERLHETLFYDHETTDRTVHERILRVRTEHEGLSDQALDAVLAPLESAARRRNDAAVRELLRVVRGLPGSQAEAGMAPRRRWVRSDALPVPGTPEVRVALPVDEPEPGPTGAADEEMRFSAEPSMSPENPVQDGKAAT